MTGYLDNHSIVSCPVFKEKEKDGVQNSIKRVTLVTGANRGIGFEIEKIALSLCPAGANVKLQLEMFGFH